ncbi:FtsX-like permease family protein [Ruminococcus flavefaciens]|uniref:FtsX-like permease family protein n=1 Tax=Ruminococcus flavefaciens TaxID=1265 RepID=A0A315Y355_RUMFL|nr:FtsX-like permease family protein [Ruminococcus flavefaciens]PWJ14653.1 FtsX-like permease family protein [Ruminococcus flavefaciens]SSA42683.1 FtsX-like permease family protein [Ruminococcus flavefaciens]
MSDKLLVNSLKKPKKYYFILYLLVVVSVFFFCSVTLFYETMLDMKYGDNKYGFQHCTIYDTSEEIISKLSTEIGVTKTIEFERNTVELPGDRPCYIDAVPQEYFSFTEYNLLSGTFPKNADEICCESSFLFELGIPFDEFIGSKIELGEKEYTVTGTFTANRLWSTFGFNEIHCFTAQPKEINSIAFSTTNIKRCQSLMNVYENKCRNVQYNMNKWAISMNKSEMRMMYRPIMLLMLAMIIAAFSHFISVIIMHHKRNIGIERLMGISLKAIRNSLFICVLRVIALAVISGAVLTLSFMPVINRLYEYTYNTDVNDFMKSNGILIILCLALAIAIIYDAVTLTVLMIRIKRSDINTVKNVHAIKVRKRETKEKISNYYIVKRHIKASWISNILTFIVICFLVCSFPVMTLYFKSVTKDMDNFEGFDYVADIDTSLTFGSIYNDAEDYMQTISDPKIEGCTAVPFYSAQCRFAVPKELITKDYIDLLSKNSDLQYDLNNNFKDSVEIPFIIVGINEKQQKQMGIELENAQAIAYRNIINYNNKHTVGIKMEYFSKIQIDEEYTLEIIGVQNNYNGLIPTSATATVLLVNFETYEELFGSGYAPSRIFYNVTKEAEDKLTSLFTGKSYINLINVNEAYRNNRQIKVMNIIYCFILIFTFIFVVMNCFVIAYLNVHNNTKEYAIMSALGISRRNISVMIAYQLCTVILISLVVSDIIALICSDHYMNSLNTYSKTILTMPFVEIMLTNVVIVFVCVVAFFLFIKKFWKFVAKERMSEINKV